MSKLVLIDGNNILHRAYYALPSNMTTRIGEPINAIYGFVSMLLRIITDLKPTHIALCFDREEPTFRKVQFESYQAQRTPTDDALKSQFKKARDVAKAFGLAVFEKAGFEADDLIGTIAEKTIQSISVKELKSVSKKTSTLPLSSSSTLFDEVIIVTGDRDMLQLVDDSKKIRLFMPVAGLSNAKLFKEQQTLEKLGVKPSQVVDYKGLVGDPSDNYPGVAGIGPKTAISLLSKYKSKKGIYKNIKKIAPKVQEKLERDQKNADLSYRLAKIVTDVPLEVDFEKMDDWQIDSPKVLDLFAEYGFRTLTKRVKEVGKQIVSENQIRLL